MVLGVAGAVVVLAAVGATGGWLLGSAGGTGEAQAGSSPSVAVVTSAAKSPTSHSTRSPSTAETARGATGTTRSSAPADGFLLPDVRNVNFIDARRKLRDLKLGVQLIFGDDGDDHSVERTQPEQGKPVAAGITVKLYVRGASPDLAVPSLLGESCRSAGERASDGGFSPRYPAGRTGQVVDQDPRPFENAHWNDTIEITCSPHPSNGTDY